MPDISSFNNPSLVRERRAGFGLRYEEDLIFLFICVFINLAKISKKDVLVSFANIHLCPSRQVRYREHCNVLSFIDFFHTV